MHKKFWISASILCLLFLTLNVSSTSYLRGITSSDLNHFFDYNGPVWIEPRTNSFWTPTGALDWNGGFARTAGNNGWGEIINDYSVQADKLLGLYHFNESSGTTIADSSGNGYNFTIGNSDGDEFSNGLWKTNALDLDGSNDWASLADNDNWTFSDGSDLPYSISAWVKIDDLTGGSALINRYTSSGLNIEWLLTIGSDGKMVVTQYDVSAGTKWIRRTFDYVISTNQWYHITGTYDASASADGFKFYVNGSEESAGTNTTSGGYVALDNESTLTRIGGVQFLSSQGNFFNGKIEEIAVWRDAELSSSEVSQIYNSSKSRFDQNLIAYYNFDEVSGTTVYDSAGGHDGTLTSGPTINARGMWDSNALTLDGSNDVVTVATINSLTGKAELSIFTWIKLGTAEGKQVIANVHSGDQFWFVFDNSGNDKINVYLAGTSSPGYHNSDRVIPRDGWHHVGFTYDGATLTQYLDGAPNGTVATTGVLASSNLIRIGASTTVNYLDAELDEFKIYDKALSQTEITADYNAFLSAKLVASSDSIIDGSTLRSWNTIKVNEDTNYDF